MEEGYLYAADYLHTINPDLIIGGHCWLLDRPEQLIDRYRTRMRALRDAFQSLSGDEDYRYMFDPYWVKALPYRVTVEPGGNAGLQLVLRNFLPRPQAYRVVVHCPTGLSVEPAVVDETIPLGATVAFPVTLKAATDAAAGLHLAALDVTRDGVRHGELFDFIAHVGKLDAPSEAPRSTPAAAKY